MPFSKYWVTIFEPGANEVLIVSGTFNPRDTAFLASRPAATMTEGLLVLVQLVIAAKVKSPVSIVLFVPWIVTLRSISSESKPNPLGPLGLVKEVWKFSATSAN